MEEVTLNEAESRYFSDLFICCDVEKTGKIPVLKATELFRSANLSNDVIRQITSIASIPQTAIHISRSQFYSCLKLIAAYQASIIPLRSELISSSISLPLPRFSWKEDLPSLLPPRRQSSVEIPSGLSNSNANNNKLVSSSNSSVSGASGGAGGSTSSLVMDSNGLVTINNETRVKRRESRSPTLVELSRTSVITTSGGEKAPSASEFLSTDSEVEHNDSGGRVNHRHRGGSPEAWSTNSDSPTPTNSVAERPWAKETLWQGLLGDEHRQLLGTEEESSDRHSSDEDNDTDLETIFQISNEQREYYHKQFKVIQPDPHGLVSGHIARVFFEKSRIPVEELRHIWQLCDVTRDGALSLAEFTSAMHLVVLRRNNIPLPNVLPQCLNPTILSSNNTHTQQNEPPEADLLHLDDDDSNSAKVSVIDGTLISKSNNDSKEPIRKVSIDKGNLKLNSMTTVVTQSASKIHDKSNTRSSPSQQSKARSISNTPPAEPVSPVHMRTKELAKEWTNQNKEWTKFTESPTSNVSSPGPKPVNFDMQRTAQAVGSDPQILHPVPLRVTPVVGPESNDDDIVSSRVIRKSENFVYDPTSGIIRESESSPKQQQPQQQIHPFSTGTAHHRESLQNNDLRAIQRPQPKKLPNKSIGAIPPPPQREPSIGSGSGGDSTTHDSSLPLPTVISAVSTGSGTAIVSVNNLPLPNKKEPPPLPPPRPRHARSSSLDLNKLKLSGNHPTQPEMIQQTSFDMQKTDTSATGFADFTQFPDTNKTMISDKLSTSFIGHDSIQTEITSATSFMQSIPTSIPPPPRPTISSLQTNQRASAFEVYRKPNTPRNSQSPSDPSFQLSSSSLQYPQQQFQSLPPGAVAAAASAVATSLLQQQQNISISGNGSNSGIINIPGANIGTGSTISGNTIPSTNSSNSSVSINQNALNQQNSIDYEKRVMAISEQLRHVSLTNNNNTNSNNSINSKLDKNVVDILRHLREQNILLLRLCNDLSQELLQIQERKEEARCKLDSLNNIGNNITASSSSGNVINTISGTVNIISGNVGNTGIINLTNSTGNSGIVCSINNSTVVTSSISGVSGGGSGGGSVSGHISTNITGGSVSSVGTHSNV